MNLSNLIVDSRIVSVDFPGLEGFTIEVAYLSKQTIIAMQKKCTNSKFDRKSRTTQQELDIKLFNKEFCKAAVKGWTGLKYKYLPQFMVVDLSKVDEESELIFSEENALILLENSTDFDAWLNEVLSDLDTFRDEPKEPTV